MAKKNTGSQSPHAEADEKKKITKDSLRKSFVIFKYMWPYKGYFFLGMLFLAVSSLTIMAFPMVTGQLVDVATQARPAQDRNTIAFFLVGILAAQSVFSFFRVILFAQVSGSAMRDIRQALYSQIICLPLPVLEQHRVGELSSRLTADVQQLQEVFSFTLAEFLRLVVTLVAGIGFICFISGELTLVMLSSFPLLILGSMVFGRFIRKLSKVAQDQLASANIIVEESLQAIQVVKAFTGELLEAGRYKSALDKVLSNTLIAARWRGAFIAFVVLAIFGGITMVLWYGLGLVSKGQITIGYLVSFVMYTVFIGASVGGLGDLYTQLQRGIGASERILEILESPTEINLSKPVTKLTFGGKVSYQNLFFAYPARPELPVLKGFSLEVNQSEKIAIVGQSGAGKSTLIQLLVRNYEPNQGRILIDNVDIASMDLRALRQNIGIVPQEVLLFGGTIQENIGYGRPGANLEDIETAARQANAWQFISTFPDGLQTLVGERGVRLSGGQRQRIAIARAILKNPAILVLDEATSSLDSESENLVQQALDQLMQNRTTFIIAHRLATVRKATRILVLEQGQIVETGTHEQLMNESGRYANLVRLQFADVEV